MASTKTPTVLVGVTGCIAAYKACELVRILMRSGCRVKVVMTENATRFVGATTFRALTREPVSVSLWDEPAASVHHISLAEEADVFVIAPATANVVAKLACGRADDLLTTTALATEAPLVIAPAMNVHMWRADATRANVAALEARGVLIVAPASGELACGDVGEGRLAEVSEIADAVLAEVGRANDLEGVSVLVTAGPTREPIDAVRFVTNASSGKTGYAIAAEAARRGATVTLVSGPTVLADPFGVTCVRVTTAAEMAAACDSAFSECDVVVASAAVSDFAPVSPSARKEKKSEVALDLRFEQTSDILATLGACKDARLLVGFAAETEHVLEHAKDKLERKNLDFVVANDVSDPALGFASETNRVWLVGSDEVQELPEMSKTAIARELWNRLSGPARAARDRRHERS